MPKKNSDHDVVEDNKSQSKKPSIVKAYTTKREFSRSKIMQQIDRIQRGKFTGRELSIVEVAKEADVTTKTIYNHPDLLDEIRKLITSTKGEKANKSSEKPKNHKEIEQLRHQNKILFDRNYKLNVWVREAQEVVHTIDRLQSDLNTLKEKVEKRDVDNVVNRIQHYLSKLAEQLTQDPIDDFRF